jgi:hypothetical protein
MKTANLQRFSVAMAEGTDVNDTSQLAVSVPGVDMELNFTKE